MVKTYPLYIEMKRKKAEKMLFFKKKKEENAEIPKYKFLVNLKGDEI